MTISIGKGKLLSIFVFLITIVVLAGPAMVKTEIRLYALKSIGLAQQPPESSEDYLSLAIAKNGTAPRITMELWQMGIQVSNG